MEEFGGIPVLSRDPIDEGVGQGQGERAYQRRVEREILEIQYLVIREIRGQSTGIFKF